MKLLDEIRPSDGRKPSEAGEQLL